MEQRVALVTGGARGIGEAIAEELARDGMFVAVGDLLLEDAETTVATIRSSGASGVAVAMDVTSSDGVRAAAASVEQEHGAIDVLVNNAGWDDFMPFIESDEEFWQKIIEINYKGVLRTTHAVLPGMMERGYGRIVNIGSDAGRVGSSLESVYSGCKGAVIAFTKTIARESARRGVTANTVCPGPTDTPMVQRLISESDDGQKVLGAMTRAVPMKRLGRPHEVAAAVSFFASERAGFTTGQTLSVSGGLTMA